MLALWLLQACTFLCCALLLQDPAQADKLTKIQRDLDETKIILHKTIESVLDRGEKLDQVRGGEAGGRQAGVLDAWAARLALAVPWMAIRLCRTLQRVEGQ
jgi:hypothetical protein